jgi:hypothetical protein
MCSPWPVFAFAWPVDNHNHQTMKKTKVRLAALMTASVMYMGSASAIPPTKEVHIDLEVYAQLSADEQARVLDIRDRLELIIATDRSTLDHEDRRALRAEWKSLKKEMKSYQHSGRNAIYISTGGLIIIILLLIILL